MEKQAKVKNEKTEGCIFTVLNSTFQKVSKVKLQVALNRIKICRKSKEAQILPA